MNSFFSSGWGNSAFHSRGNSGYHFQQERAVLQNSYRADSGGVYHRSTLISAEEKSVLEELWLRSGLKNPEITRIETSHEQTCSRDLYLLPLDQISTDYF
jgi:hypothetical protein